MKTISKEFKSLYEFHEFITTNETNKVFKQRGNDLGSNTGSFTFTGTKNFNEAMTLFKNGWDSKAKEIEKALQLKLKNTATQTKYKNEYNVVGGQVSVPRYLQGVPTSMINRVQTKQVQKTIKLTKDISYSGWVSTDSIFEYSLATLQLINAIERSGTRVELNVVLGTEANYERVQMKIRIKAASERLNISKIAFPLTHPSMLRRLLFRFIETVEISDRGFKINYGYPTNPKLFSINKNEIIIPKVFQEKDIENFIKNNLK